MENWQRERWKAC